MGETLSREDVGLSSGSEGGGLLQSTMTMRHPAADLSPMIMRRPFSLEVDDSVMRALNLSASCDMSSPQLEAGRICLKNLGVHRECTEPGRISIHGKSVAFENAPLWSYLDQSAAFATVEMRQRALRMEFSRSNPISELSILHFQRGVDFGLSESLDCTILHRLTLVSCLEMLERTLITFYSEVFRGCMSGVISLSSGMALSRSVCSNAFVTFVLDEALSIFGDDVANRSIEDFHTTAIFFVEERGCRPNRAIVSLIAELTSFERRDLFRVTPRESELTLVNLSSSKPTPEF